MMSADLMTKKEFNIYKESCSSCHKDNRGGNYITADEKDINLFYEKLATPVPLGRVGEAEEYADLATFLVSDRATYITGAAINIDGGLSAST